MWILRDLQEAFCYYQKITEGRWRDAADVLMNSQNTFTLLIEVLVLTWNLFHCHPTKIKMLQFFFFVESLQTRTNSCQFLKSFKLLPLCCIYDRDCLGQHHCMWGQYKDAHGQEQPWVCLGQCKVVQARFFFFLLNK